MLLLRTKAVGRAVLRKPHSQNTQTSLTRRHNSTHTTPKTKTAEETATTAVPVANVVAPLPLWQRFGLISRGIEAYGRQQQKSPLRTQFITSLVIYTLGDLSAQNISGDEYNPARTARALVISAFSSIPSYKWFMFLNNNFNYSSKLLSLATKVTVNQIVFTPIFNTYFFGMQSLLSGDALPDVWERIKRTVPTSMINSLKLWPAVTAFSFTFIEPQYRSIFAGFIAIGWQTYLSYLNRTAEIATALLAKNEAEKEELLRVQASTRS